MRTDVLCFYVLKVISGPRVKLAGRKSALNPTAVYSTDRFKAVIPVLVLLFVALWFILRGDLFYVLPCVILFLCFSVFCSMAITSLGEERGSLDVFRTFVRFVLVRFCLFPLPLGVWEGLRFVIVALPGLFSYPFSCMFNQQQCFDNFFLQARLFLTFYSLASEMSEILIFDCVKLLVRYGGRKKISSYFTIL